MISINHNMKFACYFLVVMSIMVFSGCAGQKDPNRVRLNDNGTMIDSKRNLMWQQVRSDEQFPSSTEADAYAGQLQLGGFDDWRLPSSQELWELYFANDYSMAGALAQQVRLDGSYWTKDGDTIKAGYLEDGDDPGINRRFFDSDKGFVRAVRSINN